MNLAEALNGLVVALEDIPALDEMAVLLALTGDIQAARWASLVGPEEAERQITFWRALGDVAQAVHETRKEASA